MLELGEASAILHREVGLTAARRVDFLLALGHRAADLAAGARQGGMPTERILVFASHEEAGAALQRLLQPHDRVLVKGSRGMKMEKVSATLKATGHCLAAGNS